MIALTEVAGESSRPTMRNRVASVATTSVVGALTLLFAIAHITKWYRTGELTGLAFAIQELFLVAFFVTRRRPLDVSHRPTDWVAAVLGAYGALLLRPYGHEVLGLGGVWLGVQVVAAIGAIACVLRLGRSFGIVAANRGVCAHGPYRFLRHPMYAFYLLGQVGYLLGALSLFNVGILVVAVGGQLVRIAAEERVLRGDETYRAYCEQVSYRLIPGLY
jgi:protein-S-isoprenylcysteine O-methyltransferase Ste14